MSEETCWTLIRDAAEGRSEARSVFARRYLPVVQRYLESRWRRRLSSDEIEDAVQEVFVECFKERGILDRARRGEVAIFHAFLYGAARNVAARVEQRRAQRDDLPGSASFQPDELPLDDDRLTRVFERAWARGIMRQAVELHGERARREDEQAQKRFRLLQLRFQEGLPIREIADLWGDDPAGLHHAYAKARKEFGSALRDVVAYHVAGSGESVEGECRRLLFLLR